MKKLVLIIGIIVAVAVGAEAQTLTPKVSKRQKSQVGRIENGVINGELTKRETVKLIAQQKEIQKTKKRAKADGKVTLAERAVIQRKQSMASKNIYSKKHNNRSL